MIPSCLASATVFTLINGTVRAKNVDQDQMQNAASDQDRHCSPLSEQFLDILRGTRIWLRS